MRHQGTLLASLAAAGMLPIFGADCMADPTTDPYAAQLLVYELYRKFSAAGALAGQVTGTLVD